MVAVSVVPAWDEPRLRFLDEGGRVSVEAACYWCGCSQVSQRCRRRFMVRLWEGAWDRRGWSLRPDTQSCRRRRSSWRDPMSPRAAWCLPPVQQRQRKVGYLSVNDADLSTARSEYECNTKGHRKNESLGLSEGRWHDGGPGDETPE